jgi:hypothetical protein
VEGEGFVSSNDKIWKKPEITSFADVEDAIAYYSERGSPKHVEAVKRLFAEAERHRQEARDNVPRTATK